MQLKHIHVKRNFETYIKILHYVNAHVTLCFDCVNENITDEMKNERIL